MLAQWFPFNSGTASAPSFSTYRLCAASREACLAEINQVVLARAALDSVLLTFLMTSVFWLRGRALPASGPGPAGGAARAARGQAGAGAAPLLPPARETAQRSPEFPK